MPIVVFLMFPEIPNKEKLMSGLQGLHFSFSIQLLAHLDAIDTLHLTQLALHHSLLFTKTLYFI